MASKYVPGKVPLLTLPSWVNIVSLPLRRENMRWGSSNQVDDCFFPSADSNRTQEVNSLSGKPIEPNELDEAPERE